MDLLCARDLGTGAHAPPQFHLPPTFSVARQRPSTSPLPSALKFFPDVRSGSGPGAGTSLWPEKRKGPCRVRIALWLYPRGRASRRALGAVLQLRGEMRRPHPGQLPGRPLQARSPNPLPRLSPRTPPPNRPPVPGTCCARTPRPAGPTRSPESPQRSASADSFHSSRAVRSATQVLLWVSSSPPLPRPRPPPACICWTLASPAHPRRVPTGAGRGGLAPSHV